MVSETTSLVWTWLCAPYLAAGLVVFIAGVLAAVQRGDRVLRIGLVGAASSVAPWSLATAAAICAIDAPIATRLHQLASGPTMMLGPSLLLILLSVSGQLDRHRRLARLATVSGAVFMLASWSTSLIIDGVAKIAVGIWYAKAGPLGWLQALQVAGWALCGAVIALRAVPESSRRATLRYLIALPALAMVATSDLALAYGIGIYPLAWLPALLGGLVALYLISQTSMLRADGLDRNALIELGCYGVATIAIGAVVWFASAHASVEPVGVALLTAPLWGAALVASWMVPRPPARSVSAYERELERFAHELSRYDEDSAKALARLWDAQCELVDVVVQDDLRALTPQAQQWLRALGAPVLRGELTLLRLGALQPQLEAMFARSEATVMVPMVYRGKLIAVAEARQRVGRALRDAERLFLYDAAQHAADALVYQGLLRDAKAASASAREVELAALLALSHRPKFDEQQGPWRLGVQHAPSAHPGGVGWSWAPLAEARVAAMIAEADPRGVAGSLAIAALQGAFAARCRESSCDAAALLRALRETVAGAERRALVLVLDAQQGTMSWASDGHRGAAIVSGGRVSALDQLGDGEQGMAPIAAGDLVVLLSSSVMAAGGLAAAAAWTHAPDLRLLAAMVGAGGGGDAGTASGRDQLVVGLLHSAS